MSKTINILAGVSTIGNSLDTDTTIASLANNDIDSIKTLDNSIWKSNTKGTPVEFQGFSSIESGKGYVVSASANTSITLPGVVLDINDLPVIAGLNMLAFPFDGRAIGDGFIPKVEVSVMKSIQSGWKSWTKGAAVEFQGFTALSDEQGYVCNVDNIFGELINEAIPSRAEGVRFNISDTTVANGATLEGVTLTDPNAVGSISFDKVTFDNTVPANIMFYSIGGNIAKIDYPTELEGQDFYVINGGLTYKGIFGANGDYSAPTVITDTEDFAGLELSYTNKATNGDFKEMELSIGGVTGIIEFDSAYLGDAFQVWNIDGTISSSVFAEGAVAL